MKKMTNKEISELLRNVAEAYQLLDPVKFKFQIIAYNRASDSIEHATSELKDLWDDGKLDEVPGIGESISKHLGEIFKTGKSKHFEKILRGIDKRVFKLAILPKVGLKTAIKMLNELKPSELKERLNEAEKIQNKKQRLLLPYAEKVSSEVMKWILSSEYIAKADVLGSLRRKSATIGDIDILASPKIEFQKAKIIDHFIDFPKKQKMIEKGDHTASIVLPGDVNVDLLVVDTDQYGSALQHFTGSKHHNIALREYARKKGLSLNEYGITNLKTKKIKKFDNEKDFYAQIGLDYIEPELREGSGEIKASLQNKLPKLISLKDVRGDLQIHSDFDIETSHDLGMSSMEEIIDKGNELGYEYLAFTEHNPGKSKHSQNEIVEILKRKREKVDKINYSLSKQKNNSVKYVFNSLEIDILPDGTLPVPQDGLKTLDFALVSIHSSFDLSREKMTKRVINALSEPKVKIFAHPTARKLNQREGVELDWNKIFEFCTKNKKFIEINADPTRLDLPDSLVRDAIAHGVKLSLGTDAHYRDHMDNMKYGVYVARRGWCESRNLINTLPLIDLIALISN